jgi:hypothetical protein
MKDPNDVIVENVTEAYRRIDRLTLISLASSGWLLVVSLVNPTLSEGTPVPKPEIPLLSVSGVPAVGLAFLALVSFFISGTLMALYYRASRKAVEGLREKSPDLAGAVDTFPSVATLSPVPRLVAFLVLGFLGLFAIVLMYRSPGDFWKGLWAGLFMGSPYIVLFGMAFIEAVGQKRHDKNQKAKVHG